jgi:outer membrane protein
MKTAAVVLCISVCVCSLRAQSPATEAAKAQAPVLWRPYVASEVPPARLGNSDRARGLIHAGNLYLTVQDALALALENNIDLEIARYGPIATSWQIQRAEAGGESPSPLNPAALTSAVIPGQGIQGSLVAAGVSEPGETDGSGKGAGTKIAGSASIAQNLDPVFQEASVWGHLSQPQPNTTLTITPVLTQIVHASTAVLQQGFLTGGSYSVTFNDHYLNENVSTDILNPSVASGLSVLLHHNLLRGFGLAVNSREITVAKINRGVSDLLFKLQVIGAVNETVQIYYATAGAYESIRSAREALETAEALRDDTVKRVEVGSQPAITLTAAEAEVAGAQRDLVLAESALEQSEHQFKSLLSRTGSADPVIRDVHIFPIDPVTIPAVDGLPALETMVHQALQNRADLAVEKADIDAAMVSALGTINGVLPTLAVLFGESQAGLAGLRRTATRRDATETASPFFGGGTANALGQIFRRDFPSEKGGLVFEAPILNRQAQGDFAVDQLAIRQSQLINQKDINKVQVDLTYLVALLEQARAKYQAAVKARELYAELLDAEQKKYREGTSTAYNVSRQQRLLTSAEYAETTAKITWVDARIALDQTLGTTLEANHVSIAGAAGSVAPAPTSRAK